jgi:curved DNA-binding protein CbpA
MSDLDWCYRVLELKPGASLEEVNQAYKDLVFVWHPDRIPKENPRLLQKAQDKLKDLNDARDRLRAQRSNPAASRNHYYKPYPRPHEAQQPASARRSTSSQAYSATSSGTAPDARSQSNAGNGQRAARPADPPNYQAYAPSYYNSPAYREPPRPQPEPVAPKPQAPDLSGSDFSGKNLKERDFAGRNLSHANLSQADLSDAFLHRVNLHGANLEKANLFRANLLEANLRHANLRDANLIGADLSGADLTGADLTGAKIGSSDRVMVKLTGAKLSGVILPDGTVHL